jgi:DNA-binding response OmpR family regulator
MSALAGPLADGVAESRPFVESMTGRVSVRDAEGGPEVLIVVPRVTQRRPTLLVVDNSPEFAQLVERYLAASEWMTRSATDVDSALAAIGHGRIGAVLLDIVLPDHDGWELLQRLKADARTSHVPVIVCSVLNEPDIALSLGASAYLQKPVTRQQLIDTLRGLLSRADSPAGTPPS